MLVIPTERPDAVIAPLAIRGRIARPQPKGLPVINLSFNESPFGPSRRVVEAVSIAVDQSNRYGDPSCARLRNVIAERFQLDADQIICGNGSEELLDVIGRVFARPGDEIVIPEYGYIQFPIVANRVGADLVRADETDFTTDVDAVLEAITPRTKIVFLANPNNPTGTMVSVTELARLADHLPGRVVLVIDLAYGEFAGAGYCEQVHHLTQGRDNVIVTRTFSKAHGLAGLRVGWCHAPKWMMPALYAGRGMGTVSAVAQAAAIASLADMNAVTVNVARLVAERDRVAGKLAKSGFDVLPSAANFLLTRASESTEAGTEALVEHLFDEAGILVNRTRETGLQTFFRFSLSLPEHNDQLIRCIRQFFG